MSHMLDEMSGNPTSSMKDTAALAMIMMASVTRQSWGTHTIWVEAEPQGRIRQTHTHICTNCQCVKVYLQEVVDGGDRMQHDDEKKNIQTDAG